jgi:hypothetical protein
MITATCTMITATSTMMMHLSIVGSKRIMQLDHWCVEYKLVALLKRSAVYHQCNKLKLINCRMHQLMLRLADQAAPVEDF